MLQTDPFDFQTSVHDPFNELRQVGVSIFAENVDCKNGRLVDCVCKTGTIEAGHVVDEHNLREACSFVDSQKISKDLTIIHIVYFKLTLNQLPKI